MHFVNRLNQRTPPVRVATDTGHSPYEKASSGRGDDVRWQLKPCQPSGPEHDALVVFAHLAAAQRALEEAERQVLESIELDTSRLTSTRKKRPIGKSGSPPEVTP